MTVKIYFQVRPSLTPQSYIQLKQKNLCISRHPWWRKKLDCTKNLRYLRLISAVTRLATLSISNIQGWNRIHCVCRSHFFISLPLVCNSIFNCMLTIFNVWVNINHFSEYIFCFLLCSALSYTDDYMNHMRDIPCISPEIIIWAANQRNQ